MKASMTKQGGLLLEPETELEAYALNKWYADYAFVLTNNEVPMYVCELAPEAPTIF